MRPCNGDTDCTSPQTCDQLTSSGTATSSAINWLSKNLQKVWEWYSTDAGCPSGLNRNTLGQWVLTQLLGIVTPHMGGPQAPTSLTFCGADVILDGGSAWNVRFACGFVCLFVRQRTHRRLGCGHRTCVRRAPPKMAPPFTTAVSSRGMENCRPVRWPIRPPVKRPRISRIPNSRRTRASARTERIQSVPTFSLATAMIRWDCC